MNILQYLVLKIFQLDDQPVKRQQSQCPHPKDVQSTWTTVDYVDKCRARTRGFLGTWRGFLMTKDGNTQA